MPSYMSDAALNRAADAQSVNPVTVQLHDGAAGDDGSTNQIAGAAVDVAAVGWTDAVLGVSETVDVTAFGVLSGTDETTVMIYSNWDGATFLGWADFAAPVVVPAAEEFTANAGTIEFQFVRP